jgi:hypothetical protein
MKYGVVYNQTLIEELQHFAESKERLRLDWVRYRNVGCQYSDPEVVIRVAKVST